MKITIIGAPESGKSAIAKRLATRLRKDGRKVKIVDNYVDSLIHRTDLAYGHFASYAQNFQILFERYTAEQEAERDGYDTITCGSVFETTLYCALHSNRDWVGSPEDTLAHLRGKIVMEALSLFQADTADYDLIFYLPYTPEKLSEKENGWDTVIDKKLPEVLEGFGRYATVLDGPTFKERINFALQVIKAVQPISPEGDERPSVQ